MVENISRREASSGNLSYGDQVVHHECRSSRIVFVPFFIQHSDHQEMTVKIQTYRKGKPPVEWILREEKSVSLQEAAARRLLPALTSHLQIANREDGNYIVVRVDEGVADLGEYDPEYLAGALATVLGSKDVVSHIGTCDQSDELVSALKGAIRLREMQSAVMALRGYLEQEENSEATYQRWIEQHPWALGNAYVVSPEDVRAISPHDQLDMMLSNVIAGYRDIAELKRLDMAVLIRDESHRSYYFSSEVSKAIGQCHRYMDVLHSVAEQGMRDHPEIVAYHPRATIVICRSVSWSTEEHKALHGLNSRLSGIRIMTYDHLLAQGERLLSVVSHSEAASEQPEQEDSEAWESGVPEDS
ncbi:DUF4263 domain-containing protein [Synechococcus sp. RSCCF101]|uniref:Shedu anti-phage system protein SduA domain-containing protein n=1 Tax=Synechococcus sp. RSCCF101 TaxID=2511069 RepID=UPI001248E0C2|nr:Shedu anti-phage system protein SduA domain-containing protein [Synechococcus sp. RSCCF101]QEY31190.1 DUF4263 domain-containing protein [Synechococcus sp. RSCCF101]